MGSRSKNFRRRLGGDDSDDDKDTKPTTITPAKVSSSKPVSVKKPEKPEKPKKLLSFVDEEDNEESPFSLPRKSSSSASSSRLAKPNSSHKMTSSKERERLVGKPSNVQPQAGQYTNEVLLELRKNTKTLSGSRTSVPKPGSTREPVIVLKGVVKPVGREDELSVKEEGETDGDLMGVDEGEGMPDQAKIDQIRAQRERLRKSRAAAPDFIALDSGSNHGAAEGFSDEEPEFQTRIAMFGEKKDGPKTGVFEDADERPAHLVVEDDEDEEERKWEEEQFRKGLGKRMDEGSSGVSRNVQAVQSVQSQSYTYGTPSAYSPAVNVPAEPPSIGGAVGGMQGFGAVPISHQAKIAKLALHDNLTKLKETHGRTKTSLARVEESLSTALANIAALEKSSDACGEKYVFLQKLRDFVSVMCDFLQHKAPYIEELEEQMQQLNKKRASIVFERRVADNSEEMAEVQAAIDAAMSIIGRGGRNSATIAAAMSAAQAAVHDQQNKLPVKLDEFGRDINKQKRLDMERRAKAREDRRNRVERKRMSNLRIDNTYQRIEGESSTDESDSEADAYKSNRDILLQTAEEVFSDAAEEFSQLSSVKDRFERWKRLYAASYRDAYISLSIPSIFSPFVRLELLKWDPLHEEVDFYDMRWHSLLFDYGVPEDGSDFRPDDVDADLVPGLVEKIALPILHHDIAHCWDMLSSRESKNAVSATSLVINYVPASSEALKELIAAIRARLADAVANLVVPTWSAVVMKAVPNAARIAAYRFGVAVRLMRNICMWKDILAMPILEKLVLDELLGGKILPHVQNLTADIHDAVPRTERVITSLSGVWTGTGVTGTRSRKLQPLVDHVLTLGKNLEKKHASGVPESEISGIARRLKKMLVELNEYDEARAILRTFHLKEAL